MIRLLSIIFVGFFLGVRHATDADHVIAVTTIVSRQRTIWGAAVIGILWGIGHTLTIVVAGGTIILFSVVIPPRIGLTMEFSVALMLILLGVLNLTGILRWLTATFGQGREYLSHSHPHGHGGYVHSHAHHHEPGVHGHGEDDTPQGWLDRQFGRLGFYQVFRPLIVGVVHGLAGSAGLALIVLAAVPNPLWAIAYLLVFGAGTIAGMMLLTAAIALPFSYTASRFARLNRCLGVASGLLSVGFGLFLAYQIGFVDRLFTGHPR